MNPADPTHPALLHIGATVVPLPMPEAGTPGVIRFPGADIWVEDASEDWLAVAFAAILCAQVREAEERNARHFARRRSA